KLAPELATTSLAYRDGDGGAGALARRRAAVVRIEGDRRIGRAAARLLNAAGVGQVHFVMQPADAPIRPELIILTGRQPIERVAQLASTQVPHLAVMAGEAIGVVGPLVVPGRTACLLCLDYVRAGNDPAWPLILAQIGHKRPE